MKDGPLSSYPKRIVRSSTYPQTIQVSPTTRSMVRTRRQPVAPPVLALPSIPPVCYPPQVWTFLMLLMVMSRP